MVFGLVVLPPSAVHANSGMHGKAQAAHHADHHATNGLAVAEYEPIHMGSSDPADKGNMADSLQSDPCCGGICLTAALCASSYIIVSIAETTRFLSLDDVLVSAEAGGHLRPPQA